MDNIILMAAASVATILSVYIIIQCLRLKIKLDRDKQRFENKSWAELAKLVKW